MSEFSATLLREKFVIRDTMPAAGKLEKPVVALSNRLTVPLKTEDGKDVETFIVRAQNMHTCLRLGAQITQTFREYGSLMLRTKPFDWAGAYQDIIKAYEKKYNPQCWAAVYHKGHIVFQDGPGTRHSFVDIIEQCDARNRGNYDKALDIAKDAFMHAGHLVNITHDANIAMLLNLTPAEGKCGIIARGPNRMTTFNFVAKRKERMEVKPTPCLNTAASFLEGIQLSFLVGMTNQKLRYDMIGASSDEAHKSRDARARLGPLNISINQFENALDVAYRPERPQFDRMIDEAEEFARKVLAKQILGSHNIEE